MSLPNLAYPCPNRTGKNGDYRECMTSWWQLCGKYSWNGENHEASWDIQFHQGSIGPVILFQTSPLIQSPSSRLGSSRGSTLWSAHWACADWLQLSDPTFHVKWQQVGGNIMVGCFLRLLNQLPLIVWSFGTWSKTDWNWKFRACSVTTKNTMQDHHSWTTRGIGQTVNDWGARSTNSSSTRN